MFKSEIKSEKGMTLVSLVVAIVILLALAGTVVYLVFGKNGVGANSPVVVQTQDRNYVKSIVTVGLKAVRAQVNTTSVDTENNVPQALNDSQKMDILIMFLDNSEFMRESDTVIKYKKSGIEFTITVDFGDYKITKIE